MFYHPKYVANEAAIKTSKWGHERVGRIADRIADGPFGSDLKVEEYKTKGYPLLRVSNIRTGEVEGDLVYISDQKQRQLKRSKVYPNDVLLTKAGAILGYSAVFPRSLKEGNITSHLVTITCKEGINPHFLSHFFRSEIGQLQIYRWGNKSTRPELNTEEVKNILVTTPPNHVQARIVEYLNAAYAAKKQTELKAQQLLTTIDDVLLDELGIPRQPEPPNTLESRIFKSSFATLTGQRWDPLYHQADIFAFVRDAKCSLQRLGRKVNYFVTGFPAGRGDQVDEDDGGIIQIRPTNLSDDRELVFKRNVYIAASELKTRKADVLKRDEVLFNNTNSQEQVGKTVWFDLEGDYFSSNHITRIGVKTDELNPQYLTYVLNLYQRRKVFFKLCTNWNNQSGVGSDILQRVPIPLPKLARQAEIVKRLESVRAKARDLREQARSELEKAKRDIEALILGKESSA